MDARFPSASPCLWPAGPAVPTPDPGSEAVSEAQGMSAPARLERLPAELLDALAQRLDGRDLLRLSMADRRTHGVLQGHTRSLQLRARAAVTLRLRLLQEVLLDIHGLPASSLRAPPLAALASRVRSLPPRERGAAWQAVRAASAQLRPEFRPPALAALVTQIPHLSVYDSASALYGLLDASRGMISVDAGKLLADAASFIEYLPSAQRAETYDRFAAAANELPATAGHALREELLRQSFALAEQGLSGALTRTLDILEALPVRRRAEPLARLVCRIVQMPDADGRGAVFDRALAAAHPLPRSQRRALLAALATQIASLPDRHRLPRWHAVLHTSINAPLKDRSDTVARLCGMIATLPAPLRAASFQSGVAASAALPPEHRHTPLLQLLEQIPSLPARMRLGAFASVEALYQTSLERIDEQEVHVD